MSRRRYARRTVAAKPADDGCLLALGVLLLTWGLGIGAILLAIALHR
jgi:hypothetical protein